MQYPKQINRVKGNFNPGVAKYRQRATLHFFNKYKISIYEDKRPSVAEGSCDYISGNMHYYDLTLWSVSNLPFHQDQDL